MPLRSRDVADQLQNKFGFSEASGHGVDHRWFELNLPNLPTILTKVSHGRHEIDVRLETQMARQLHVRRPFFVEMMRCTRSRDDYIRLVYDDPQPPFPPPQR